MFLDDPNIYLNNANVLPIKYYESHCSRNGGTLEDSSVITPCIKNLFKHGFKDYV